MRSMRIVEFGIAQPHLHIGYAKMIRGVFDHRSVLRPDRSERRIAHGITQKIRRQLLLVPRRCTFPQGRKRAMQLRGHRVHQNRLGRLRAQLCRHTQPYGQQRKASAKS